MLCSLGVVCDQLCIVAMLIHVFFFFCSDSEDFFSCCECARVPKPGLFSSVKSPGTSYSKMGLNDFFFFNAAFI